MLYYSGLYGDPKSWFGMVFHGKVLENPWIMLTGMLTVDTTSKQRDHKIFSSTLTHFIDVSVYDLYQNWILIIMN